MSTSAVATNNETDARGTVIVANDGFFFSLNETYASPGLIVATAAQEERANAGTHRPVRHATAEDTAVIDALLRAMGRESPIFRAMPIDDRKLADYTKDDPTRHPSARPPPPSPSLSPHLPPPHPPPPLYPRVAPRPR